MGVRYCDLHDIDRGDFDAVVVGSGFAGSVMARELAERGGKRVLVIEKKPHIAGNMYDEADEAGHCSLLHQQFLPRNHHQVFAVAYQQQHLSCHP